MSNTPFVRAIRGKSGRRIAGGHWWIAAIAIALYGSLLCKFSVNMPIDDDYDNIIGFYIDLEHAHTPVAFGQLFFAQHNENRMLFNRIVFFVERQLAGGTDLRRLILLGNVGVLLLFGLLVHGHRGRRIFPFAVVTSALLLFQPSAYESMFWAMDGLLRNYALGFALLSFLLVERGSVCAAAFFACLSFYQQVNGILALLLTVAWLLWRVIQGDGVNAKTRLAAWVMTCVGAIGVYFAHYVQPPQMPSFTESIVHPFRTVEFFLAFAGSGVGYLGLGPAVTAGMGVLCLAIYLTYRRYFFRQPALYAFLLFLLGSAALAAVGRSPYGVEHAIRSRYAVVSNCLFACVVIGVASLVDSRRPWRVAVKMGFVAMALAHACAAYAYAVPAITERREELIDGAALFAQCGSTAKLEHNSVKEEKILRYMEKRGYWSLPSEAYEPRRDEPCPRREGIPIEPMQFSAHEYRGEKLARTMAGSVAIAIRDNMLRVELWADIPSEDPQAAIYLGVPVLPSQFIIKDLMPNAAGNEDRPAEANVGLEILATGFPPDTDLQALMSDMCIGYESTSLPLTLFAGNLPICTERLVAQEGEPSQLP